MPEEQGRLDRFKFGQPQAPLIVTKKIRPCVEQVSIHHLMGFSGQIQFRLRQLNRFVRGPEIILHPIVAGDGDFSLENLLLLFLRLPR